MAILTIKTVSKSFDQGKHFALSGVSLQLQQGEICALVGQSGSGKTTLLRLIAGLENPQQGQIEINGQTMINRLWFVPPHQRNIGFVFQDYALFPHLTVAKNIGFGIASKRHKTQRIAEMLKLVDLEGYGHRYPHELSGGEQQRVALARALAPRPTLLLLDEPFSNLDPHLKAQVRNELFRIIRVTGVACIFVTHDTQDAMAVADRMAVLNKGRLVQIGTPQQLFNTPHNFYVATLFGTVLPLNHVTLALFGIAPKTGIRYGVRPTSIQHSTSQIPNGVKATILHRTFMGYHFTYQVMLPNQATLHLNIPKNMATPTPHLYLKIELKDLLTWPEPPNFKFTDF